MSSARMRKISIFWRGFAFCARYSLAAQNMGLWGAFKVYILSRWNSRTQSVHIRGVGEFWYRGKTDFGVMSHFYNPNFRIVDTPTRPVRRIIDGGANIGDETRRFAYFHKEAAIVAVEPEQDNYEMLKKNVSAFKNVVPLLAGLWPRHGSLSVQPAHMAEAFSVTDAAVEGPNRCEAVTVPDIMRRMGWTEIDILKLDIEGAEYELFGEGVAEWIENVNCLIFECPDAARAHATARIFKALPSECYWTAISGECLVVIKDGLGWTLAHEELL